MPNNEDENVKLTDEEMRQWLQDKREGDAEDEWGAPPFHYPRGSLEITDMLTGETFTNL